MEGEVGTSSSMAAVADSLRCERKGDGVVVNESKSAKFPLSSWEIGVAATVVLGYALGLGCVYLTMPASDYSFLKLPRNLEDLQILRSSVQGKQDYAKSVLYPVNEIPDLCEVVRFLACNVGSFPAKYLGLCLGEKQKHLQFRMTYWEV